MLTNQTCKTAKPADRDYKLSDSGGLYLHVMRTGARIWRWKYRIHGKEKVLTFGRYPEVSLVSAREKRDEARKAKREGLDPSVLRKQEKAASARAAGETFEIISRDWHARQRPRWISRHSNIVLSRLQKEVFPFVGPIPIRQVTPPMVLEVLRRMEKRGANDIARRVHHYISATFIYAIASGSADWNPAADMQKALPPVPKRKYPALRTIEEARELLKAVEAARGHPLTKLASRLLALTAVRSGPLRHAEWGEFQLEGPTPHWRIPAAKMKLDLEQRQQEAFDFIVPLAPAAVEIVRLVASFSGNAPYLFPNGRSSQKPMSENALSVAYRRLPGFASRHVPHGWRSTFSTIMNELAEREGRPGDRQIIDLMLAHQPKGIEGIYNRAAFMPRRHELAQIWAELLLEGLPPSSSILDIQRH